MKIHITYASCLVLMLCLCFVEQPKVKAQQANSYTPVPIQVMSELRATNFAVNTALITHMGTTNILSNMCAGYIRTNATWILYSNSVNNTGSILIGTITEREKKHGFWMPTVTQPDPNNQKVLLSQHPRGSNDVCIQATFKAGLAPSVLILGFTLTVSNWNPEGSLSTFRGFDLMRIGQSPYVICQFGDGSQIANAITLQAHTPDGAGVGGSVVIVDNGEIYDIMLMYDAPNDIGAIKVYQKLTNGRYQYKGESRLVMAASTAAENVFIGVSDDHSGWGLATSVGGDFRISNIWSTTNREAFLNHDFPRY